MYKIIPENEYIEYSYNELKEKFNGKWVYLVHAFFSNSHGLEKAIPVVVADSELEGIEEGIYEIYHNDSFGRKADADFTNMCIAIPSALWSEGI